MPSQLKALMQDKRLGDQFLVAVEGADSAAEVVSLYGHNADIDTNAEDIHDGGGDYVYPTQARVHALVSDSAEDEDDAEAATGDITVDDIEEIAATQATGTITYGSPANGDTVVVNGRTFTKRAVLALNDEFTSISTLAILINSMDEVSAEEDETTITITAATAGEAGNDITLTKTGSALTLSGATLSGGEDTASVTVNGVEFVGGTDFEVGADEDETASNLAAAINESTNEDIAGVVTAEATTDTVTVTAVTAGDAGNSIEIETNDTDAFTVDATLSDGADATLTGSFRVRVTGLDADYEEISEVVDMSGTTPVNTENEYLRINKLEVVNVGSAGAAVGNITATAETDSTVSAKIVAGGTKWLAALYTVPAGKSAFVLSMYATTPTASMVVTANLVARLFGGAFLPGHTIALNSSLPLVRDRFTTGLYYPEKTDLKLRASTSDDDADVYAGAEVLVVKN